MKKKICIALLGLLSLGASAQEDTREEVLEVVATSDISEIIGYAKTVKYPEFTMSEGSVARISYTMTSWQKKNDDGTWKSYESTTFADGVYRVQVQVRVDGDAGSTHKLGEIWSLTVDGQLWNRSGNIAVNPTYSYCWATSPDIVVDRTAVPLEFTDLSDFDIPANFVGKAINSYSVLDAVIGGELPYTFGKTSGPDWIQVSADGTISGTPEVTGVNDELVVRVTDNASEYKEITISVGNTYINQDERQKVTDIVATSNISEILQPGGPVRKPSFTMSDGSVARIAVNMSYWKKKGDDGKWVSYSASVFEEGVYSFCCQIRIDGEEGYNYVIGDGWTLTVDGQKWGSDSFLSYGDGYSYTYADLPEVSISKEVINELTVTNVVEPIEGNDPDNDATLGDNCNLGACVWKEKDQDSEWKSIQGLFTASKLYGLYFRGFPKNGYKFADDMKVIYKGSEIPVSSVEVTDPSSSVTWRDENYVHIFLYFDNLSGVESVTAESTDAVDVYNLQGILVKRNATKEDINSLPAGLYIAGGKKVMLK